MHDGLSASTQKIGTHANRNRQKDQLSARSGVDKSNKNAGGFGIFDKIYNYLNRQTKEDKELLEKK